MPSGTGDRVAAGLLLTLAVGVFAYTFTFPPPTQELDPGVSAFPRMIAVLIAVLSIVLLVRPQSGEALPRGTAAVRVALTVVLLWGYAMVLDYLGFVITSVVFLLAELLLIGVRRPTWLVLAPLGISLLLFYLFRVFLDVPLPVSGLGGLPI